MLSWRSAMENKAMDPVALEVIWNRFMSVANEQQDTLIRTAFSTIVRESQDLACGLFDTRGRMIAQSLSGTPGHINAMATSMKHFLAAFPPDKLAPGDVLITNDPWQTAGQINDITITTPIFRNGKMVALFANTCHSADIGGRILSAEAREVFEEGLRIPIMKLFERGEPNQVLMQIVRANVRQPDEVIGDFYAQTASNDAGGRALLEMMEEFGLDSIDAVAEEIIRRSETAVNDFLSHRIDRIELEFIHHFQQRPPAGLVARGLSVKIADHFVRLAHVGALDQLHDRNAQPLFENFARFGGKDPPADIGAVAGVGEQCDELAVAKNRRR